MPKLEPLDGDIAVREWQTVEGDTEVRHILLVAALRPHRYVARPFRGHGSKSYSVKSYSAWWKTTHERVAVAMAASGVQPFPADWVLGNAISSAALPESPLGARLTKSGEVDKRSISSVLSWDLRNLDKGIEDCMKGILWGDDRQVRTSGPGAHFDTGANAFAVHCWGNPTAFVPWQHTWDSDSVPYEYTWLRD